MTLCRGCLCGGRWQCRSWSLACLGDGKFSLDCLRCVGACGLAPVVMVGEHVYGRLDVKDIRQILENAAAED